MKLIIENEDRENIHSYLKEVFDFPEYYGMNLDALYDCLTDINVETEVELEIRSEDPYLKKIGTVFIEAAKENENLKLKI